MCKSGKRREKSQNFESVTNDPRVQCFHYEIVEEAKKQGVSATLLFLHTLSRKYFFRVSGPGRQRTGRISIFSLVPFYSTIDLRCTATNFHSIRAILSVQWFPSLWIETIWPLAAYLWLNKLFYRD